MLEKILKRLGIVKSPRGGLRARCVLVVDDNRVDLMLLKRTVEKMGHRVLMAEDGEAGLELAQKEKPDLILSDCSMPQMDGVTMFKRLKEIPEIKHIPFVFLTGVGTPNKIVECFDMGAANFLCKPIKPGLLTSQITQIFEEHLVPAS